MTLRMRKTLLVILAIVGVVFASLAAVMLSACKDDSDSVTLKFMNGTSVHATRSGQAGSFVAPVNDPAPASDEYKFVGWTTEQTENALTVPVPDIMPEKSVTFYAKFSTAPAGTATYYDLFGGGDILTVSGGKITLNRELMEPVDGYYNWGNGYFRFGSADSPVLEGLIQGDGFFYFKDISGVTFKGLFAPDDALVLTGENTVLYTSDREYAGTFTIDPLSGDFNFKSYSKEFIFRLDVETLTFDISTGAERGYYVYELANGYEVLLLDGFPLYESDADGNPKFLENSGTAYSYNYNPALDAFILRTKGSYALNRAVTTATQYTLTFDRNSETSFRITDGEEGEIAGYKTRGGFVPADAFEGGFINQQDVDHSDVKDLVVDGYGRAVYKTTRGSYTEYQGVNFLHFSSSGLYYYSDAIIIFRPDNGSAPLYFRLEDGQYGPTYLLIPELPYFRYFETSAEDIYGNVTSTFPGFGFYYYYQGTSADGVETQIVYVWSYMNDVDFGKIFMVIDVGYVTESGDGDFRFLSSTFSRYTDSGELDEFTFDFKDGTTYDDEGRLKLVAGKVDMKGDEVIARDGQMKLVSDKYGNLTYTDKSGVTKAVKSYNRATEIYEGAFVVYELFFADDTAVVVMLDDMYYLAGEETPDDYSDDVLAYRKTIVIPYDNYYTLNFKTYFGQRSFDDILLVPDDGGAITRAAIKISYSNLNDPDTQLFSWVIGTVSVSGGVYSFEITDKDDFLATAFSGGFPYTQFKFKPIGDACYHYDGHDKSYTLSSGGSLVLDGYGFGTLTITGGFSGDITYEMLEETIFVTNDIGDVFTYYITGGNTVASASEEAGAYTFMFYPQYYPYMGVYMTFSGDAAKTAYYQGDTGTYEATGLTFTDGYGYLWTEYKVTFIVNDEVQGGTTTEIMYIAVSTLPMIDSDKNSFDLAVFMVRNSDPGTFEVALFDEDGETLVTEDGEVKVIGTLSGNGFSPAGYITDLDMLEGYMDIGYFDNSSTDPSTNFVYDLDGDNIYFTYYISEDDVDVMIFDIVEHRGKKYAVARPYVSGAHLRLANGALEEDYIVLDGYGSAVIYDGSGEKIEEGTYASYTGDGDYNYLYTGTTTFTFKVGFVKDYNDNFRNVYIRHDATTVFTNARWEILSLDIEGFGTFVDHYGNVYEGEYTYITEKLVGFQEVLGDTYGNLMVFDVNTAAMSFARNLDEFVIEDGVLLVYQGVSRYSGTLKIPDGVKIIGEGAFRNLGGVNGEIDFNEVEEIRDFAFYNVYDLIIYNITSDKITWIGDYAFYSGSDCFSAINSINLPNLTHIGDYAFYGNNQFNIGTITLKNIEYIGARAFSHNTFNDYDQMTIDLTAMTAEQLANLHIDETAFLNYRSGWGTKYLELQIFVADEQAKAAILGVLPEDFGRNEDNSEKVVVYTVTEGDKN